MPLKESTNASTEGHQDIEEILGLKSRITVNSLRHGLPTQSIQRLGVHLGLTQSQVLRLLGFGKQRYSRREERGRLTVDESDLVVRFARLLVLATLLFEDNVSAASWLNTPAVALGNETPLAHATTGFGARNVERLIGRLEQGIPT